MVPLLTRFMAKIDPQPDGGCWLWTAGLNERGYGRFRLPDATV